MKKLSKQLISNPLFSSGFIMIMGTNGINFINYIYHLLIGRILGPAAYGELAAFFSLIGLLSVIPLSFSTVVIKFIASSKDDKEVSAYLKWFMRPVLYVSILLTLLTLIASPILTDYLNTPYKWGVILIGVSFLFGLPASFYRSVLQGLIKFNLVVVSLVSETGVKLLAGLLFVGLGFGVMGALVGLLLSIITGWLTSLWFLKKYRTSEEVQKVDTRSIFLFTLPVLVQTFAMTSLMSVDLVLVKHFFTSFDAGIFAAVSTLGKILLFATAPVSTVMFPIIARQHTKGENFISMFLLSIGGTALVVGGVIILYSLFPYFVLSLLYGDKYFSSINLLVPYAFFTGLLSLSGLFISFFLSINHNKVVIFPMIAAFMQLVGINIFHKSIIEVVWVSVSVATLLFCSLSIYFFSTKVLHGNRVSKS